MRNEVKDYKEWGAQMADAVRGGREQLTVTAGGRRRAGRGGQTTGSLSPAMSCSSSRSQTN